jgi:hypothetical protein
MSSDQEVLMPHVSKVLLSRAAVSIDFWANGMHVYGGGYYFVWYAISKGWISLGFVRPGMPGEVPQLILTGRAEAVYDSGEHILWFPRNSYGIRPDERAAILHECTHALRGIMLSEVYAKDGLYGTKIKGQQQNDNEAAAYIAQVLFYLYDTGKEWPVSPGWEVDVYASANDIARKIANRPGAQVDGQDYSILKTDIATSYLKFWDPSEPDHASGGLLLGVS